MCLPLNTETRRGQTGTSCGAEISTAWNPGLRAQDHLANGPGKEYVQQESANADSCRIPVAAVALRRRGRDGVGGVGYWVVPAARGSGVASRALGLVSRWALSDLGLHRLELEHSTLNEPSCRVAAKAGYVLEGTKRSQALHDDGWHDMHLHALINGSR